MWKKALLLISSAVLVASVLIYPAQGKEYPTKSIELLCPFPAGGSIDLYSRLVADRVSRHLGQPIIVINKPGGAGTTVAADMISSKPDGYKLGVLFNDYFSIVVKTQKIPFNPSHIIPLMTFAELKVGLKVKGDSPWKTLNDLLDYARKNPGKLKWGHSGRGLLTHINPTLIFRKAGVDTIDIPYKGAPESITALLGGHIDAIVQPYGAVAGHIKSGTIRYVVFFSDRRYGYPSDVPCALELGFPEASKIMALIGVFAHKDTPDGVKKVLSDAFKKTFEDPEFKSGIEKIGDEPRFGGPELMIGSIKRQEEVTVPILKELGTYVGN
jgi:tripartite-type tricarboxylate transporter receptor subunit TctC